MTRSAFGLTDRYVLRHEQDFFRMEGYFVRAAEEQTIVVKYLKVGRKKTIERNGVAYTKYSAHIGLLPVVLIAPDDTLLITEGSEARRRFLDHSLSQSDPYYLSQLIAYDRLLKQRNALLKQYAERGGFDGGLLGAYDKQMEGPARYLYEARLEFAEYFTPIFQRIYERISGGREQVSCSYDSKLDAYSLLQLRAESLDKDRVLQRTTTGPHRDDLTLLIDGQPVRRYASQGQLKSYVLSLKLGQFELLRQQNGAPPILLLDDLFDKLDHDRVTRLLTLLVEEEYGQIIITDTSLDRVQDIVAAFDTAYRIFEVESGTVALRHERD